MKVLKKIVFAAYIWFLGFFVWFTFLPDFNSKNIQIAIDMMFSIPDYWVYNFIIQAIVGTIWVGIMYCIYTLGIYLYKKQK